MKMILKYVCFCIFVASINGTENLTELYISEHSEDYLKDNSSYKEIDEKFKSKLDFLGTKNLTELYESKHSEDYLKDNSSYNEIYEEFKLKLDFLGTKNTTVLYESKLSEDNSKDISYNETDKDFSYKLNKLHNDLKTLNIKTLELENENFKLKERLTETEENLTNYKGGFEKLGEEQKETKEILEITKNDLKNTEKGFNELKADLVEIKEKDKKSEEGLKKLEEEIKVTKDELKVTKDQLKKSDEDSKEIKDRLELTNYGLMKTVFKLKEIEDQLKETRVVLSLNNKVSHYHLFTDINGKNKAFIIPLDGMKHAYTFDDSVNLCKNFDSTLIEIESKEKQLILESFLSHLFKGYLPGEFQGFWLNGLRDSSGEWKWLKSNTPFNFTYWAEDNPRKNSLYNNIFSTATSKWFTLSKTTTFNVICEHSFIFTPFTLTYEWPVYNIFRTNDSSYKITMDA